MSDFFQLVEQRESCRNYDPQKRPTKEQLVRCIQAAQLSPSACNSQPWSFLVINSPEKAAVVAASTQCAGFNKFTDNCPSFIAVCEEDAYLMGDPQHPNQKYADIDLGIAVAHLCYAAKQQGLSTCIMGAFDKKMLLEGLGITEDKRVRLVLSVGYAANDQLRTKKRKPLEQMMEQKITEVVAALIVKDHRFLICQRPAHKTRGLLWEFVGGKVEPGETLPQALIRECREELGIRVTPQEIFMQLVHTYPDITVRLTLFWAQTQDTPQRLEHNDLRWISVDEIDHFSFCPADRDILAKLKEMEF